MGVSRVILIGAALLGGQAQRRAIGQWVDEHSTLLADWLAWPGVRLPSEATARRALRLIDLEVLEAG